MLTTDDRRVREALINTHHRFTANLNQWGTGAYEKKIWSPGATGIVEFLTLHPTYSRCMMGEVMAQLDVPRDKPGSACADDFQTYQSTFLWFNDILAPLGYTSPLSFNDETDRKNVLQFLEARISDLDRQLYKDAPPKPKARRGGQDLLDAILANLFPL